MIKNEIWIVGAGLMGIEYGKVLNNLGADYIMIGRSEENCQKASHELKVSVIAGGIDSFLEQKPPKPKKVIVAVGIEALKDTVIKLLDYNVDDILLEKPGFAYPYELNEILAHPRTANSTIVLAYNRRFYGSVMEAEKLIADDGGVTSFSFEFTEWSHVIRDLKKDRAEHETWFLGNSSHVIDTAFFLAGEPKELSSYYKGGLDWHPISSIYAGAGISERGALFSYIANWESPGRWVIDISTSKRRFLFKPMEVLQIQEIGSVSVNPAIYDVSNDKEFKPGLYLQTKCFLESIYTRFCTIQQQAKMLDIYCKMSGYNYNQL
jgi:predicted dehydrogenase